MGSDLLLKLTQQETARRLKRPIGDTMSLGVAVQYTDTESKEVQDEIRWRPAVPRLSTQLHSACRKP